MNVVSAHLDLNGFPQELDAVSVSLQKADIRMAIHCKLRLSEFTSQALQLGRGNPWRGDDDMLRRNRLQSSPQIGAV